MNAIDDCDAQRDAVDRFLASLGDDRDALPADARPALLRAA